MSKTVKNYAISFLKSTLFGLDKDVSVYGNTLQINEVIVSTNVEARGSICDAEAVEAWEWVNVEKWKLLSSKSKDDSDLKEAFDFLQEVMFDRLAQVQRDYDSILKGYRISAIENHVNSWTQDDDDDIAREQEERLKDTLEINNSARDYQEVAKALVAGVVIGETIPEELEDKLAEADSVFYETMKERKEYYQKIEVQYDTESEHDKEVSLKANPRRNFLHEVMARGKLEYNEVLVDDSQPIISVGKKASEVFGGYIADTRAEKTREDYEGYSL